MPTLLQQRRTNEPDNLLEVITRLQAVNRQAENDAMQKQLFAYQLDSARRNKQAGDRAMALATARERMDRDFVSKISEAEGLDYSVDEMNGDIDMSVSIASDGNPVLAALKIRNTEQRARGKSQARFSYELATKTGESDDPYVNAIKQRIVGSFNKLDSINQRIQSIPVTNYMNPEGKQVTSGDALNTIMNPAAPIAERAYWMKMLPSAVQQRQAAYLNSMNKDDGSNVLAMIPSVMTADEHKTRAASMAIDPKDTPSTGAFKALSLMDVNASLLPDGVRDLYGRTIDTHSKSQFALKIPVETPEGGMVGQPQIMSMSSFGLATRLLDEYGQQRLAGVPHEKVSGSLWQLMDPRTRNAVAEHFDQMVGTDPDTGKIESTDPSIKANFDARIESLKREESAKVKSSQVGMLLSRTLDTMSLVNAYAPGDIGSDGKPKPKAVPLSEPTVDGKVDLAVINAFGDSPTDTGESYERDVQFAWKYIKDNYGKTVKWRDPDGVEKDVSMAPIVLRQFKMLVDADRASRMEKAKAYAASTVPPVPGQVAPPATGVTPTGTTAKETGPEGFGDRIDSIVQTVSAMDKSSDEYKQAIENLKVSAYSGLLNDNTALVADMSLKKLGYTNIDGSQYKIDQAWATLLIGGTLLGAGARVAGAKIGGSVSRVASTRLGLSAKAAGRAGTIASLGTEAVIDSTAYAVLNQMDLTDSEKAYFAGGAIAGSIATQIGKVAYSEMVPQIAAMRKSWRYTSESGKTAEKYVKTGKLIANKPSLNTYLKMIENVHGSKVRDLVKEMITSK